MKSYPQSVVDMLASRLVSYVYLVKFSLENELTFTSGGHDIEYGGSVYQASGSFQGLDSLNRTAEMRVSEVKFGFSMADPAIVATILGTDVFKREVRVERAYLSQTTGEVLFVERVWSGTVVGKSDDDSDGQIQLTAASRWSQFERTNTWRTSPHSHKKRHSEDEAMKYAAMASNTVYWAGKAGAK
ncbi:DUF2163 domain-containing protein [Vibrio sp. ABG19]|uniref:DUF2163 domain-containing protein n=1 Tax=Vibrio sp. ABG19 TaxID=2817385 RepID=UPI00249DBCFC|nr:DUF2163 domain-containing protein [Vibrio sp. ABG19]WGY45028.1 DUF2163 domain-containing protein [Vibrio sp. ABG19]